MAQYRRKPVTVEAWPIRELNHAARHDWQALPECVRIAYENGAVLFAHNRIEVSTLDGWRCGGSKDWLIRDAQGGLEPCNPAVFAAAYESADTPDADAALHLALENGVEAIDRLLEDHFGAEPNCYSRDALVTQMRTIRFFLKQMRKSFNEALNITEETR